MRTAVWMALLDPGVMAGRDGIAALALPAIVFAGITLVFMASVGRRLLPRRPGLAVLLGSAFAPMLMIALALLAASGHPAGSDGGGILVFVALALSAYAIPVTAVTSALYLAVWRRRRTG